MDFSSAEYNFIASIMTGTLDDVQARRRSCNLQKVGIVSLRQALCLGKTDVAKYLIAEGANHATTLYHCVTDGSEQEVKALLGCHEFAINEVVQACGMAIIKNHPKCIELLFHEYPQIHNYSKYLNKVAMQNNETIMPWLHEKGYVKPLCEQTHLHIVNSPKYKH